MDEVGTINMVVVVAVAVAIVLDNILDPRTPTKGRGETMSHPRKGSMLITNVEARVIRVVLVVSLKI